MNGQQKNKVDEVERRIKDSGGYEFIKKGRGRQRKQSQSQKTVNFENNLYTLPKNVIVLFQVYSFKQKPSLSYYPNTPAYNSSIISKKLHNLIISFKFTQISLHILLALSSSSSNFFHFKLQPFILYILINSLFIILFTLSIKKYSSSMKNDITCVFEGVAGVGAIYISNLQAAQNKQLLQKLAIKAIVTAVRGGSIKHDKSDVTDYLYVPADDIETYDLSKHFEATYKFIDDVRKKTNVLVHCYAGISRSATIVIAYLLKKYNYSLLNVIQMVKRRRNKINPNRGFLQQLKQEAKKMNLPVEISDKQFAELLKQKNRSLSKEFRKSYSTEKAFLHRTQQLRVTARNFNGQLKYSGSKGAYESMNQENIIQSSKAYRTFQGISKQPKEINQNELQLNRKVSFPVQKIQEVKANTSMNVEDIEKYMTVDRKTKIEDLTKKIERIKFKILESSSKTRKRTRSQLGSPMFSMADPHDFKYIRSNKIEENCQKQQIKPTTAKDISLKIQSLYPTRSRQNREISNNL